MTRFWMTPLVALLSFGLVSCANLQTINRTTKLPGSEANNSTRTQPGLAIHLDAQQRLVIVNALRQYCAEPSPDALAAYASSLGLGYSNPSQQAVSLSQALGSSAGSIGLRTQSITLMRDALYRMCEAYSNEQLGPVQVALLLRRSQDLTAVILAVEQLTGAVAANQVILTGSSSSGASASLLANQQLLEEARKDEEAKKSELTKATDKRKELEKAVATKSSEYETAQKAYSKATEAGSTATDQDRETLKGDRDTKKVELDKYSEQLKEAKSQEETRALLLEESKKVRETIEGAKDAALTSVVAGTTGGGQMSVPLQRNQLDKDSTLYIADAVQAMVFKVLDKRYEIDTCMDVLTFLPAGYSNWKQDRKDRFDRVQTVCADMVSQTIVLQTTELTATFHRDAATQRLEDAVRGNPEVRKRLAEWIASKKLGITPTTLMNGKEYATLREEAVRDLNIP